MLPARQQTLRKTIQWSYDLLSAQEQRLFRRLSVFVGGCTWQAIEAVSATFGDETTLVFDTVASLIDKNLLRQTAAGGRRTPPHDAGDDPRVWSGVLSLQAERWTRPVQAHAAYYLALAEEASTGVQGPTAS